LFFRVERNLKDDFAYGGFGLDFATHARPASFDTGLDYLGRLLVGPVPRVFWSGKPVVDPNWEMTENYWGTSLASVGFIRLFTPLGEAIFYFGYLGLVLIPLLYGFTVSWLERLYSSSPAYRGLLAQVYVWAFLGMRHTFWNLFGALVVTNFLLLLTLFLTRWYFINHRKNETNRSKSSVVRELVG